MGIKPWPRQAKTLERQKQRHLSPPISKHLWVKPAKPLCQISHWECELAFHGSGHILHSIYWTIMGPTGCGGQPGPCTQKLICGYFGSFSAFQEQFSQAAIKVEASGWAILAWQPVWNRLEILNAEKHQNLTQWGSIPVLVLDAWEHA
jgi:Fe-Mn family superoxide dismutase